MKKYFIIYFLTAIASGYQLYWLRMWGVWGRGSSPLETVAFCGSVGLLISAFIALKSLRGASIIALISTLLLWTFYAPATFQTIASSLAGTTVFSFINILPPILILVATIIAGCCIRNRLRQVEPS